MTAHCQCKVYYIMIVAEVRLFGLSPNNPGYEHFACVFTFRRDIFGRLIVEGFFLTVRWSQLIKCKYTTAMQVSGHFVKVPMRTVDRDYHQRKETSWYAYHVKCHTKPLTVEFEGSVSRWGEVDTRNLPLQSYQSSKWSTVPKLYVPQLQYRSYMWSTIAAVSRQLKLKTTGPEASTVTWSWVLTKICYTQFPSYLFM